MRTTKSLPAAAAHANPGGAWQNTLIDADIERFVFIDETWAKTNMCRRLGRSLEGAWLIAKAPHAPWQTTTFIA